MTDNEIVKALERCGYHNECCYCNSVEECGSKRVLADSCRNLINRQKAEIEQKDIEIDILIKKKEALRDEVEELRKGFTADMDYFASEYDSKIKSEAINEFADKLKEYFPSIADAIDHTAQEVLKD